MKYINYRRPLVLILVAGISFFFAGVSVSYAQTAQVRNWQRVLQRIQELDDEALTDRRDAIVQIRRGVEFWIDKHPDSKIILKEAPSGPESVAELRAQAALLLDAVEAMLNQDLTRPFELKPITIRVMGEFREDRFTGPMFTETNTKTRITENGIRSLNPASMTSILRAVSLIPSVNQQSVDPLGLADISNFHESFRFRGVEATGGGNPSTPVNIENIPVTGRPGGGANICDLENFRSISIYKGGIPADKALGLTNIGGKIDLEVKRPEEKFHFEVDQAFGAYGFRRSFARISTGLPSSKTAAFLSYSNTHADKWKGEGDTDRNNVMVGLTQTVGSKLKVEAFSIHNQTAVHAYRPLNYEKASSLDRNYDDEYSNDPGDYQYYGYNKSRFTDYNIFANIEYAVDGSSGIVMKPFYWKDKGYYQQSITTGDGSPRIRRWDINHDIRGVMAQYSRKWRDGYLNAGYSYLDQERPGPPTSWKLYRVSSTGLVFDKWQILSNSSRHRQHVPFVSGKHSTGALTLEGSVKYVRYSMPEIMTYVTSDLSDVSYDQALGIKPAVEANASARSKNFNEILPSIGLSYLLNRSLSAYFSYGRNHGLSVSLYPFFISQKSSFYAKGISLQKLWDEQKLETADNFDVGLRYGARNLYVTPTFYFARHKNKTATYHDVSLNATFPSAVFDAEAHGFEVEAGAVPVGNLSVYSSFSYNRFSFSQNIHNQAGSIIPVDGKQVPDAPKYMAKAGVACSLRGLTLSPSIRYTSSRYGDILQTEIIAGAALVDLDLAYTTAIPKMAVERLKVSFSINNLLDKKYISIINTTDYATLGSTYQTGAPFTVQGAISAAF
jgi:iron complex outermembrane receptor protein